VESDFASNIRLSQDLINLFIAGADFRRLRASSFGELALEVTKLVLLAALILGVDTTTGAVCICLSEPSTGRAAESISRRGPLETTTFTIASVPSFGRALAIRLVSVRVIGSVTGSGGIGQWRGCLGGRGRISVGRIARWQRGRLGLLRESWAFDDAVKGAIFFNFAAVILRVNSAVLFAVPLGISNEAMGRAAVGIGPGRRPFGVASVPSLGRALHFLFFLLLDLFSALGVILAFEGSRLVLGAAACFDSVVAAIFGFTMPFGTANPAGFTAAGSVVSGRPCPSATFPLFRWALSSRCCGCNCSSQQS
jgi:hypothetical protein